MEKYYSDGVSQQELAQRVCMIRENICAAALSGGHDPDQVEIMAVTKYVDVPVIRRAAAAGIRLIGENREQVLSAKFPQLERENLQIHFIGRLQRNKAARVVRMVHMVQSLDSLVLAAELDRQAGLLARELAVLVEVNIGRDPGKTGVDPAQAEGFVDRLREYPHLNVRGMMTILPLNAGILETEQYFSQMHALYVDIRAKNRDNVNMNCLSMGMSGDYKLAVKHGSTMVRLGTVLFG